MGKDSSSEVDGVRDSYAQRSFVDEGSLESIHQANATFLALVARRMASHAGAPFGIAAEFAQRVASLDAPARRRAAECPYTLFNLRFEDDAFWREVAHDALAQLADERAADAGGAPASQVRPVLDVAAGDAHVAVFALKAAFLAWHLARNTDGVAAVALGMTPGVMDAWRTLPLPALDRCAGAVLPCLAARWGANARFWGPLLDAAERPMREPAAAQAVDRAGADGRRPLPAGAERRMEVPERVHLLGLQLLAADGCRGYLPKRVRR